MNRCARENSAYLKHAASQPVDWYPWGDEAFEKALREDKPIFLSSGAIWCHWCHVMAKESFQDAEAAAILNEQFVPVKLDRDERPDIDRRYQRALGAMGLSGGWPLSMFLTPDLKPFYGGTYFPPTEVYGRPAFTTLLLALSRMYRERKEEINDHGRQLLDALAQISTDARGEIDEAQLAGAAEAMLRGADKQSGGFGTSPKFPMSGALEFLFGRYGLTKDEGIGEVLRKTLTAMARGGFHDQLAGGFHRYSTDPWWMIPHFEKMADDNAWLLRNYVDGCRYFDDPFFKESALGIIRFTLRELSDPEGGFYASQDADVTADDEGGYFTWTEDQFRETLDAEEFRILSLHLFQERGIMHHAPEKKTLSLARDAVEIATTLNVDPVQVREVIARGKAKLLAARETREQPFIDRAVYTSLNGMFISAFLKAYRVLGDETAKAFALKSLKRVLSLNVSDGQLEHSPGVKAMLDDYVYLADALVMAYEVTGDGEYLDRAAHLMNHCLEHFWDGASGGFFDTEDEVLGVRLKGIEDIPHPSANGVAIVVLRKLAFALDDLRYSEYAEKALGLFVSQAAMMETHGGSYFSALDYWFNVAEIRICAAPGSALAREALSVPYPCMAIAYGDDTGRVTPCIRQVCYEPVQDGKALAELLRQIA